ncbi:hypothetical protein D9613_005233 [Agrocybe pediades]|uniref:RNA polymerase II assembly factor Rtp1 C-terminal domain-containing protein n=1 Tax=Agrocybe pediades TaxID=84607 RepID=A0A8H4R0C4_9AGAR|nr:hypothetical protein D9613_005233 [Agrocybe pediades]
MSSPVSNEALLQAALSDGAILLGTSSASDKAAPNMETVLKNRVQIYYDQLSSRDSKTRTINATSLDDIQLLTAKEALSVVQRVQSLLDLEEEDKSENGTGRAPAIGTRDLAQLRTMLSILFKWALNPLFSRVNLALPTKIPARPQGPKIIDLTLGSEDYQLLSDILMSLFSLVFPEGPEGRISQTLITTSILNYHVQDILFTAITLGWLPESFSSSSTPVLHEARSMVMRLLKLLTPFQAILALGGVLSSNNPLPPLHARKTCKLLLTKQLLRPEGVRGLLEAMFSSEDTDNGEVKLERLEQVATTLNTVPANMNENEYYSSVFPRVIKTLVMDNRVSFKRATAFTIYRAIIPQNVSQKPSSNAEFVLNVFQRPFLDFTDPEMFQEKKYLLRPDEALSALTVLLSNTEPSPLLLSRLLTPIISELYLLSYDIDQVKTADPSLKESINDLLLSWGKIIDRDEGSQALWAIIEGGKAGQWHFNLEGRFWKTENSEPQAMPDIILPGRSKQETEGDEFDVNMNLFQLYPDPGHFVQLLKRLDRGDIASSIFIQLLENYRDRKGRKGEDSMTTLLRLQIIMQMQSRLSEGTTANILRKPGQLLSFILHVLESAKLTLHGESAHDPGRTPDTVEDLSDGEADSDDADSDDEAPDSEVIGPDDELIETAVTLLLSILEADDKLSAQSYPILNDIFTKLEPLALNGSSVLRPLAREARLVITARLAQGFGSSSSKRKKEGEEDVQEIYQKALKLLQDPILPVRAHGLLLLRQLVGPEYKNDPQLSSALLPSILSIFRQSVQDEDSYIFLNAVQGLAALVDVHGKEILQGLVRDYASGLEGLGAGNLTRQDVDVRTRIGEALSTVIKRIGSALGLYVDVLVPPLFATVRKSDIPTTLRTSSLSLLGDCVDTYALAVMPYIEDLYCMVIDLLQIESQPMREVIGRKGTKEESDEKNAETSTEGQNSKQTPSTMDSDPTSNNSRFPPLRRAALHFLSLLVRSSTKIVYEDMKSPQKLISQATYKRTRLTLGYISATDEDNVVRVMAKEAKENLEELQKAELGL